MKEILASIISIPILIIVWLMAQMGIVIYAIYNGIDYACNIIYEYWKDRKYLHSIFSLLVSALLFTVVWVCFNETAVEIYEFLCLSKVSHGAFIVCLFALSVLTTFKSVKDKKNSAGTN